MVFFHGSSRRKIMLNQCHFALLLILILLVLLLIDTTIKLIALKSTTFSENTNVCIIQRNQSTLGNLRHRTLDKVSGQYVAFSLAVLWEKVIRILRFGYTDMTWSDTSTTVASIHGNLLLVLSVFFFFFVQKIQIGTNGRQFGVRVIGHFENMMVATILCICNRQKGCHLQAAGQQHVCSIRSSSSIAIIVATTSTILEKVHPYQVLMLQKLGSNLLPGSCHEKEYIGGIIGMVSPCRSNRRPHIGMVAWGDHDCKHLIQRSRSTAGSGPIELW
mmetsp:Transcript_18189/g.45037  ORF Transcript_18189/g.45037 Transcript_18189/m.45037 type:complete len:274 (-) Transcript_18189:1413-2234(-)